MNCIVEGMKRKRVNEVSMSFKIVRNNIINVKADMIVNTANPRPVIGGGTDTAVYEAAGREKLMEARRKIGVIAPGKAAVTKAYGLDAKYIAHAVSPVWVDGQHHEAEQLRSCYVSSLKLAENHHCESIAFPLMAAGSNGFPNDIALKTALDAIQSYLMDHEMDITLVVFDKQSFELSEKVFKSVESYIEEHQVAWFEEEEYKYRRPRQNQIYEKHSALSTAPMSAPAPGHAWTPKKEQTFQVRLLHLIDASGRTDPDVYKAANIDRKLFAKIRKNENYKPSKKTVIALALALHLSLDDTVDLLSRAGFALSPSVIFDLVIRYCLENDIYNIFEVNAMLFKFDQETL